MFARAAPIAGCIVSGIALMAVAGDECTCPAAKPTNGWCRKCRVGYVAGIRIESELLYEELDAHGHTIDPEKITCPTCRAALETDGFCDKCAMGFVRKEAYMSRISYHLARGMPIDPATLSCAACSKNAASYGWCDKCKRGIVGPVAMQDREHFDQAAEAYEIVRAALRMMERCQTCAVAMVLDGYCPDCKIQYQKGKPLQRPSEPERQKGSNNHEN
jgi:hypothetical protein